MSKYPPHVRARFNGVTCQADPLHECTFPRCSCADIHDAPQRPDRFGIFIAAATIAILFCVMLYLSAHGYLPNAPR